jgi:REP element-mobilizing transposase RayT
MASENCENKSFAHDAHSIGVSEYHLQWVTKYRYETLLKESHYKDCETALKNAAARYGITLKELDMRRTMST